MQGLATFYTTARVFRYTKLVTPKVIYDYTIFLQWLVIVAISIISILILKMVNHECVY